MEKNYTSNLKFLGAVGDVTPSSTIVQHTVSNKTIKIMVDAWITPGGKERLIIPTWIDSLILSHAHVDHVWELPKFFVQNPDSRIFVPQWNKDIIAHNVTESHRLSMEEKPEAKMSRWLNTSRELLNDIQSNIPKKGIKRWKWGSRIGGSKNIREIKEERNLQENILENAVTQLLIHLNLDETEIDDKSDDQLISFFRSKIDITYNRKLEDLRNKWIITRSDVARAIGAIIELPIGMCHKILQTWQKDIRLRFDPTGHLVTGPACSVWLELPLSAAKKRNILFSGDQWNPNLWYEWTSPDFKALYNKYHSIVLESTYWDRVHPDRSNELRQLDAKILEAIRTRKDILVVSLALERPIYVLYEILECLKNSGISKDAVDISYFWESIAKLFQHFPKGEIRDIVKPFIKPLIPTSIPQRQKISTMAKLGKVSGKTKIIISSGGFFHENAPSARILAALYPRKLLIISPNFHGDPGSNGHNLFHGEDYQIENEFYEPNPDHDLFIAQWFSGHGDSNHLIRYARKNARDGKKSGKWALIFLNHGSDKARDALTSKLAKDPVIRSKKAKIVSPKTGRTYKANQ